MNTRTQDGYVLIHLTQVRYWYSTLFRRKSQWDMEVQPARRGAQKARSFWLVQALDLCSVTTGHTHFTSGYLGWLELLLILRHHVQANTVALVLISAVLSCNALGCKLWRCRWWSEVGNGWFRPLLAGAVPEGPFWRPFPSPCLQ